MHAFLVHQFDSPDSPDTLKIYPETSIGIEEVRQIQSFLSKKPIQSPQNMVLIYDANLLTIPAQNALLKTLEEPPGNAKIYLITTHPDTLLSTILSRVQIINHTQESHPIDLSHTNDLLKQLFSAKIGERLQILESQEFTRELFLKFLDEVEYLIHTDLSLFQIYPILVNTRKYLKSNCNLKLCLAYLATNITNE